MSFPILLDSDVLIDYLRGRLEAVSFVQQHSDSLGVSSVSVAELYVGVREGRERDILDRLISVVKVHDVDATIAKQAGLWRRDYGKTHGTGLMDALIAATAKNADRILVTLNAKHFPMLNTAEMTVPYRKN